MSDTQNPQAPQGPQWRIATWFPDLDPAALDKLRIYHDEVQKFNRTLNLVSAKTLAFADVIHFADAILGCRAVRFDDSKFKEIYDFGSGNGFPGLVFAILNPDVKVILIDSDQKKCEFMQNTASLLGVSNAHVKNCTIESLEAGSVKTCMARGLTSISRAILMTRKCVALGGVFYHFKTETWSAEVGEIPTQLCSVWTPALVGEYKLPIGPMKFAVVKTLKIA